MADVHDPETRSYNMSQIRGKDTKPELIVRKYLFSRGFRYKIHDKKLPGKPDIVLPKYNTVINIHGCFWHGHSGCRYFVLPGTRSTWWAEKIERTKSLDKTNKIALKKGGWKVLTIYECELRMEKREKTLTNLVSSIQIGNSYN